MSEKPILFQGWSVRATLADLKTMTRRVVKPQPTFTMRPGDDMPNAWPVTLMYHDWPHVTKWCGPKQGIRIGALRCPYGQPGDTLWVRETFYYDDILYFPTGSLKDKPKDFNPDALYYRADGECCQQIAECCCDEVGPTPWRPSIHLPRWACRLFLRVKSVRVERVQDISEEDARAEGIYDPGCGNCGESSMPEPCGCDAPEPMYREGFVRLWNELNSKRGFGWDANPWVWVVEYERIEERKP